MAPREAALVCDAPPLPPVVHLDRWLWIDTCIRDLLPASLLHKQRMLVIGGSGMGKTLLTRQLVVLPPPRTHCCRCFPGSLLLSESFSIVLTCAPRLLFCLSSLFLFCITSTDKTGLVMICLTDRGIGRGFWG